MEEATGDDILDLYVDGILSERRTSDEGLTLYLGLIIPSGTTPTPDVEGALFLDTDASTNGSLMIYSNSGWRLVKDL